MTQNPPSRPPSRNLPPLPTTPLRSSTSRTSLRASAAAAATPTATSFAGDGDPDSRPAYGPSPLGALEPAFAELADAAADLEANFMHLQLMHEALARFAEGFAAFLYGMSVNAFCVDFGNAPGAESWARYRAEGMGAARTFASRGDRAATGDRG